MPADQLAVIDTNVLRVANRNSDQADDACVSRCIEVLMEVVRDSSLALDDAGEIMAEYSRHSSYSGQPGAGDRFFRWAYQNQYQACRMVRLTAEAIRPVRSKVRSDSPYLHPASYDPQCCRQRLVTVRRRTGVSGRQGNRTLPQLPQGSLREEWRGPRYRRSR